MLVTAVRPATGGAPWRRIGADDSQQMWIDPTDRQYILLSHSLNQGATIAFDRGATWSSCYSESTEQVYHVAADDRLPYWIYASQQDAGVIRARGRSKYGAVTMFDGNALNGWEWGAIRHDPLRPCEPSIT